LVDEVAHACPNHPAVLSDLIETYEYLNDNLRFEGSAVTQLAGKRFFLNVDDPQDDGVEWVWNSADRISFDTRDFGGFRAVRPFLRRFRHLLLAAGAQEVNYPVPSRSFGTSSGSDSLSRVREKFSQMRQKRHLVDVRFVADDDEPDSPLLGHKSFLATQSNHLMKVFCNDSRETSVASDQDEFPCPNHSRACIALVLGNLVMPLEIKRLLWLCQTIFMQEACRGWALHRWKYFWTRWRWENTGRWKS